MLIYNYLICTIINDVASPRNARGVFQQRSRINATGDGATVEDFFHHGGLRDMPRNLTW